MKRLLLIFLLSLSHSLQAQAQDAQTLLKKVVEAVGGLDAMHKLKDVSYSYNRYGVALEERYIFDGEISWGKYKLKDGTVRVQFFDGKTVKVWDNGKETLDKEAIKGAWFNRKTNYYWLAMMQKMTDPGIVATYNGKRTYEGIEYDLLDVTFEDGVGVAKDRYLLYVNPYTKLVDQFLFTVAAAGRQDPIFMKYGYDTFSGGVKFPVTGQSRAALNWEGDLDPKAKWSVRWRNDFRFNNGYTVESILK